GVEIHDLPFAHAARRGLADAEDLDAAVAARVSHHGADFTRADFKSYVDAGACHGSVSCRGEWFAGRVRDALWAWAGLHARGAGWWWWREETKRTRRAAAPVRAPGRA